MFGIGFIAVLEPFWALETKTNIKTEKAKYLQKKSALQSSESFTQTYTYEIRSLETNKRMNAPVYYGSKCRIVSNI